MHGLFVWANLGKWPEGEWLAGVCYTTFVVLISGWLDLTMEAGFPSVRSVLQVADPESRTRTPSFCFGSYKNYTTTSLLRRRPLLLVQATDKFDLSVGYYDERRGCLTTEGYLPRHRKSSSTLQEPSLGRSTHRRRFQRFDRWRNWKKPNSESRLGRPRSRILGDRLESRRAFHL